MKIISWIIRKFYDIYCNHHIDLSKKKFLETNLLKLEKVLLKHQVILCQKKFKKMKSTNRPIPMAIKV